MSSRSDRHPENQPLGQSPGQAREHDRTVVIRHAIERVMRDLEDRFDGVSPRQSDVR